MKDIDFDVLFRKAEELRAIFILGQRLVPFIEDIFGFVNDIKPLLDDMNISMEENVSKMQNASIQLSKVTEATETATFEIMDTINGLISKSGTIASNMRRLDELDSANYDAVIKVLEIINKAIADKKDISKYESPLSEAIDKLKAAKEGEYKELLDSTEEMLNSINNDSNSIMISLQVQDITSQQLAAVNNLLETIQDKIGRILMKFQSSDVRSSLVDSKKAEDRTIISTLHRPIAFNHEDDDTSYFSQDDIDSLFGKL